MNNIKKGVKRFIVSILIIDILFVSITFNTLVKKPDSIKLLLNRSSVYLLSTPLEDPLFPYKLVEMTYNYLQTRHYDRTNVDLELFKTLVKRGQLELARSASLHNIYDCNNLKYLSEDGKDEYIVKVEYEADGDIIFTELIYDPVNRGTYNLFNQEGPWITRRLHKIDVYLWILFGTGSQDTTSILERFQIMNTRPNKCEEETEDEA